MWSGGDSGGGPPPPLKKEKRKRERERGGEEQEEEKGREEARRKRASPPSPPPPTGRCPWPAGDLGGSQTLRLSKAPRATNVNSWIRAWCDTGKSKRIEIYYCVPWHFDNFYFCIEAYQVNLVRFLASNSTSPVPLILPTVMLSHDQRDQQGAQSAPPPFLRLAYITSIKGYVRDPGSPSLCKYA